MIYYFSVDWGGSGPPGLPHGYDTVPRHGLVCLSFKSIFSEISFSSIAVGLIYNFVEKLYFQMLGDWF